ncbi:hypothetical protein [Enterococcus wangshanyuanii]|uniref:Uncharacterized protein n=1 Tax=Enterococcus wangshanyuanii TaxID=2005703 RepID=A0ABQ1PRU7_9ENTE|nr:hypothetical protein [Enterococcus wangshanyuanii]GGD02084.1 hypothetical protein GCM10011573_34480 [Enterococcus wangshanyuanii]
MKNVYLINETDYIVANNSQEAVNAYADQTEVDIDSVEQLDPEKECLWSELKDYSKEYITSKSIRLDFSNIKNSNAIELGTLTVADGVLVEWRNMNEVIEEETEELPYLLMSKA